MNLAGMKTLVCGGTRGIGRAVAERLQNDGARVCVAARKRGDLPEEVTLVLGDLATIDGCRKCFDEARAELGGIDLLLINTGGPPAGPALSFADADWSKAFELSFLPVIRLSRLALPDMIANGFGRIVAITSISAIEPIDNLVLSNALRPAVHGFIKTLAREIAPSGVTINAVAPGYTDTERLREVVPADKFAGFVESLDMKRLVDPDETAALVAFLMSKEAAAINGAVIRCDGGQTRGIG